VWSLSNGVLVCRGAPRGYWVLADHVADFTLSLEWLRPSDVKPGKAGVLFRVTGPDKIWPRSLEAQLNAGAAGDFWGLDGFALDGPAERKSTVEHPQFGQLTNLKRTAGAERPAGEWNRTEIDARGGEVVLRINGVEVNRATGCDAAPGRIVLTAEGDAIHFRNVRLQTRRRPENKPPNIVFLFTDDQRYDALGTAERPLAQTPNLDRLAARGTRFANAFVTLSICSPSRAAVLTGQYGSVNGVTTLGQPVKASSPLLPRLLRAAGYRTGHFGKWHLGNKPEALGFDEAAYFMSNGTYYGRKAVINGREQKVPGYIDAAMAERSVDFMRRSKQDGKPFFLWFCTQLPHMDHTFDWPAEQQYLDLYVAEKMPLPETWNDTLVGKPPYLATARSRTQALSYGYDDPAQIRRHRQRYAAAVTQMDAALGQVIDAVAQLGLADNTWFVVMGDNGWLIGEHGLTSKVLAYEESMRVPVLVAGPSTKAAVDSHLVLNIDLTSTILEIAGRQAPAAMHGRSLLPLMRGDATGWRDGFVYEAPTSVLGVQPILAARSEQWKLIRTYADKKLSRVVFDELYDLEHDPTEMHNLAADSASDDIKKALAERIEDHRRTVMARTEGAH
jgi:arylsulfatase A-like enzyme